MQLILNTYGSYLHRQGDLFRIKASDKVQEIAPGKISGIFISTSVTMSSDAVKLAVENNIDIVFMDKFGNPYGRVWHGRLGSTARIRRVQLEVSNSEKGLCFALEWVIRKMDNQIEFLKTMRSRRTKVSADLTEGINYLKETKEKIAVIDGDMEDKRMEIMGLEGSAGRRYFQALNCLIPEKYQFEGRSRNPAKDYFNCLLNYSYGVLYSMVERACILAGLDPYIGFLHADNYNKISLVFDIIENYRIWADETVINLFSKRMVKQPLFDPLKNGFTLNKEGKAVLMGLYMPFLDQSIRYRNRNIKRRDIVQFDCHRLAQNLIGK